MVWRCCKLIIRFLEGREQIRKFVRSCFRWPWIRCYNCASELRLSLRLGIHFNKSLINIFQLVWLFYDDPERSYDRLKLTSIFIKLGVTQVLTYPWTKELEIFFCILTHMDTLCKPNFLFLGRTLFEKNAMITCKNSKLHNCPNKQLWNFTS